MSEIVGILLGPGIGISVSPLPIVGLVLILLSNEAKKNSVSYSFGWILGNAIGFLLGAVIFESASGASGDPGMVATLIKFLLGLALLVLSVKKVIKIKNSAGQPPKTPKWFDSIATLKMGKAFILGLALSFLNPKNLALSFAAGSEYANLGLGNKELIIATTMFLILASMTIIVPTVLYFIKGESLKDSLDKLQVWLIAHNDIIMAIMLFFLGLNMVSSIL